MSSSAADSLSDRSTTGDPQRLPERVSELVQEHRPAVIMFDSFKAISDLMPDIVS